MLKLQFTSLIQTVMLSVRGQALNGRRACGLGRISGGFEGTVPCRRGTGELLVVAKVGGTDDRTRKSEVVVGGVFVN